MRAVMAALVERDPAQKLRRVQALTAAELDGADAFDEEIWAKVPGRPDRPRLVAPREVPSRGLGSAEGRAALVHAVAHIEFNAINLALDAVLRFPEMPAAYREDWLSVAKDEARHFSLLVARLAELGYAYGDFPAHNGLWEAAEKTAQDPLVRMACVPRVLEARGLDVTPGMIERLRAVGDEVTANILVLILNEEIGHVAVGTRWFRWLCAQRHLDASACFESVLAEQGVVVRPPINRAARAAAGFSAAELDRLPQ